MRKFSALAAAVGVAAFVISGANVARAAAGGTDSGSNYGPASPWVDSSNGGSGFNPWAFNGTKGDAKIADAATLGSSPAVNLGAAAFAVTDSSAPPVKSNFFALRGFNGGPGATGNSPLADGQTFTASIEVNFRDGIKGLAVEDGAAAVVAGVGIEGGDYYFRTPGSSANPAGDVLLARPGRGASTGDWSYNADTVLTLTVTRAGGDLKVTITRTGGATAKFTAVLSGKGKDVEQLSLYCFGVDNSPEQQLVCNNLSISPGK